MTKSSGSDSKNTLYCSFCGKSQHEVWKLIAGPTVFICDECVELCMDIIREEHKTTLVKSRDGVPGLGDLVGSDGRPEELARSMRNIAGQIGEKPREGPGQRDALGQVR